MTFAIAVVCGICVAGFASAQTADSPRLRLVQALESMIAAEPRVHYTHDDGEWLQLAVTDSIAGGDRAIERLAVRAASPLVGRISRPVSGTHDLPALEISTTTVLRVPRPIEYRAQIFGALDGGEFRPIDEVSSGAGGRGRRLDLALGAAAAEHGFHTVRLKASLRFGNGQSNSDASWTEMRELPALFYAVYDVTKLPSDPPDIRSLVYSPAAVPVKTFDPSLDSQPFAIWLATVLSARSKAASPGPDWIAQFCSERTGESGVIPDRTGVCAVVYFQAVSRIGQIWFRTADVHITENGVRWDVLASPKFEGFVIGESAPESMRLSALPSVLDADPTLRPVGDVAISPDDIRVTSAGRADQPLAVTINVRNQGTGDLFKVLVRVTAASSPTEKGVSRQFVVDIPAQSSTEITLQSAFPAGYGVILAHALQLSEHSPFENWTPDPTPEDACAFRIVNQRLAPPRYIESLGDTSGCRGK